MARDSVRKRKRNNCRNLCRVLSLNTQYRAKLNRTKSSQKLSPLVSYHTVAPIVPLAWRVQLHNTFVLAKKTRHKLVQFRPRGVR